MKPLDPSEPLNGTAIADKGFSAPASASPATYGANGEISSAACQMRPSLPILDWRDAPLRGHVRLFLLTTAAASVPAELAALIGIAVLIAVVFALGALLVSAD